jgi:hypothetical protein
MNDYLCHKYPETMNQRPFLLLLAVFFLSLPLSAQVTITSDEMPVPGDTIRKSVTFQAEGINFEETGQGYTWDFSDLTVMLQQVDTFKSVSETPIAYQLVFNNFIIFPDYIATVVTPVFEFDLIPGFEVSDVFWFFKASEETYEELGFGVGLNGLRIPVNYDEIDVIYNFPMEYGNADSSESSFIRSIDGLGTAASEKFRRNFVDGWGTLLTPFGSFDCLRVKTMIYQYDSVFIDSTGTGFPIEREITEYKWLSPGYTQPLLNVREEGMIVTITYPDSLRTNFLGIPENELSGSFQIYPNPASDHFNIEIDHHENIPVDISILNLDGRLIHRIIENPGKEGKFSRHFDVAELKLKSGIYLLMIRQGKHQATGKLIVR